MISVHLPFVAQQIGNDVITEVILGVGVRLILLQVLFQDIPVKDIDTHGSQV